ncbi:MAG: hypothetical protein WC313_04545 [Candidatus Kapaibacterium sp.]
MKNIIVFIIALLISVNLSAQTKQPGQKKLNYFGSNIYLDQHQDFKQSGFVFGWHWYNSYKLSQVLGVNMIHVDSEDPFLSPRYFNPVTRRYADNAKMIINAPYIGHHWQYNDKWSVSHNIGFLYEPTYKVDLTDPAGTFVPRKYDTTRYAFGFGTVKGFIDTTNGSVNYNRLQLFDNDSIRGQVVLAEPYVSDGLSTRISLDVDSVIDNSPIENIYRKPSPLRFNFIVNGDSLTNQTLSRDYFQQTKFMLGTQWGGHSRMLIALKMNSNHAWQPHFGWSDSTVVSPADPADSMKYIWYGSDHYNCRAFQFKPTLYIPEYKRGEFVIQPADTTNSIFGFSYIRDTNQLFNNPTRTKFHLYRDSINYIDSVVLGKVWLNNKFEYLLLSISFS